jgi:hypothetical protein
LRAELSHRDRARAAAAADARRRRLGPASAADADRSAAAAAAAAVADRRCARLYLDAFGRAGPAAGSAGGPELHRPVAFLTHPHLRNGDAAFRVWNNPAAVRPASAAAGGVPEAGGGPTPSPGAGRRRPESARAEPGRRRAGA